MSATARASLRRGAGVTALVSAQVALMAAAELQSRVSGVFLINCAGGMNAKGACNFPCHICAVIRVVASLARCGACLNTQRYPERRRRAVYCLLRRAVR